MPHPSSRMRRKTACRAGAAAVEFALVLPLLVALMWGGTDLGRFAVVHIGVTNAARAGAGYGSQNRFTASTQPVWEAGIRQTVLEEMQTLPRFDPNRLNLRVAVTTESDGSRRVEVQVAYPFDTLTSWAGLANSILLQQTVVLPIIRY